MMDLHVLIVNVFFNSFCLQMELQGGGGGIFHGIVKGFKREKLNLPMDLACSSESLLSNLEDIFMRNSSLDLPEISNDAELNIGFCLSSPIAKRASFLLFMLLAQVNSSW